MPNENVEDGADDADTTTTPGPGGRDGVEGVFVVDGNVARFRPVEVGIAGDSYFEVLSGLEEGTTIVSGTFQAIRELEDGSVIRVEDSEGRSREARAAVTEEDGQ